MTEKKRKLRISHVTVQAVLVWDDGEELTPGPEINPFAVTVSTATETLQGLPAEVLHSLHADVPGEPEKVLDSAIPAAT